MYRRLLAALVALPILVATTQAQMLVSPRAGLVHHLDGEVLIENHELDKDGPPFGWVGEGEVLRTGGDGRCEVVLAPGSVLRVGPASTGRLLSTDITDVRVELVRGSAVIDWRNGREDRRILLAHDESRIELRKHGIYRLDAYADGHTHLRVFDGQARLARNGKRVTAREGEVITLGSGAIERFDTRQRDALDAWSAQRAEFIAKMNRLGRNQNQRMADGVRSFFRHLAEGKPKSRPRPVHACPHASAGGQQQR